MTRNRFGLSRDIPVDVTAEVRRRSKFGCVNCRNAIYQYEHIDPEFADARVHCADDICLLCGGCHDKVTRGRISKETIRSKYVHVQESASVRRPFEDLDLTGQRLTVKIGSAEFEAASSLISFNGQQVLSITPPHDGSASPTLTGLFCDSNGTEVGRITDNVWEGPTDAWDIVVRGATTTVRTPPGQIALSFTIKPPDRIEITQLNMKKDRCHVVCNPDELFVGQLHPAGNAYLRFEGLRCQGPLTGISVHAAGGPPMYGGMRMEGGKGIFIDGTGIRMAVGASVFSLPGIALLSDLPGT